MARISKYPNDNDISLKDRLLGTNDDDNYSTKQYSIQSFIDFLIAQGFQVSTSPTGVGVFDSVFNSTFN